MIKNEQQEIELSKFIDKVKSKCNDSMNASSTAQELQESIANMCLHCLLPASKDCEICNWHSKDQLFINFESLEEKPKRHDWDGDND